ncbi:MAG: NYN domain-containing protein [Fimbriimonadaceae bacterium]|nr:NYN domain-containing protein [Fimbriimonadaceae bacterium]
MADNINPYAALFVDFENLYYFIKNRTDQKTDPGDTSLKVIRSLKTTLHEGQQKNCIIQHAYADFERVGGGTQGDFYLMGIETHNVLGTEHKNAADMRLCIDALDTLYTRPEIDTFVFVAGDRDYIPVIQHLRARARSVIVVAFKDNLSGDLLQVAEERNFIDATTMLPTDVKLTSPRVAPAPPAPAAPVAQPQRPAPKPSTFATPKRIHDPRALETLRIMLHHFSDKPEIWMIPFLHRQRSEMSQLEEFERKALLSDLVQLGAIAIEQRLGDVRDYSVIVVNWNHPDVVAENPG